MSGYLAECSIEGVLARGGMAEILVARRNGDATHNASRFVIKKILPHLAANEEIAEGFARESVIATQLVHPNIVHVFETGVHEGAPSIAMELLDGLDLKRLSRELLKKRTQLHTAQSLAIAAQVAHALAYAHEAGVVHRDVSPHNIFIAGKGVVKLLDFGVAKTRAVATQSGLLVGKPAYMAPEQIDGLRVDGRSDLFSLGVVLWEMLAGRRLWDFENVTETIRAAREDSVLPPSIHNKTTSNKVDALVLSLVAKFPAGRPARAAVVATELDAAAREHGSRDAAFELAHVVAKFAAT